MGLPKIRPYELPTFEELPKPRIDWQFRPEKAALLVHDMQRYFVGAFAADAEPIAPVIANISRLTSICGSAGIPVIYTAQNGNQDPRDRGLQADLWGPGMSNALEDQHILEVLAPSDGDMVFVKHRYSAFQLSNLAHFLAVRGRNQLVICGVYAHIGCLLTSADAFQRDIQPFFVGDAVADFSRQQHDMALNYVAATCGIPISTAALYRLLNSCAGQDPGNLPHDA